MRILDSIYSKIMNRLRMLYEEFPPTKWKWVVSFSGGKDSSALLTAVLDFAQRRGFHVMVLHSDTTAEIPAVAEAVRSVLNYVERIGAEIRVLDKAPNFFTLMLERGYSFPRWNCRWCVRVYKYGRILRYLRSSLDRAVNLVGIRGDERRVSRFITIDGSIVTAYPLIDVSENEVWNYLEQACSWYQSLKRIYRGNRRLGCWTCTVIKDDPALRVLDPELYKIKLELVKARCTSLKVFLETLNKALKLRPDAFPNFAWPRTIKDATCRGKCVQCNIMKYWIGRN